MSEKAIVLIDGGYISKLNKKEFASRDGKPCKIDYGKIGQILTARHDCELLRAYYYDCPPHVSKNPRQEEKEKQRKFDQFLYNLRKLDRFSVRLGQLKKYYHEDGTPDFEQKGVDVQLAIDALTLTLKNKVNKIILISGDADFVPVIEAIKDEGVEAILYYHESSVHRHLLEACDTKNPITADLIHSFQ